MRRRIWIASVLLACVVTPVVVFGQDAEWREIVGTHRMQQHGTHPVTVQLRQTGERSCMLGNCRINLETRGTVHGGELNTVGLRYFYSDGEDREPGCPARHRDTYFEHWTEAEIGPARYEDRPSCGITVRAADGNIDEYVIRRTRRLAEEAAPAAP